MTVLGSDFPPCNKAESRKEFNMSSDQDIQDETEEKEKENIVLEKKISLSPKGNRVHLALRQNLHRRKVQQRERKENKD